MSSTPSSTSRPTVQARDALMIGGIQKHLQNVAPMTFGGTVYTSTQLIAFFQSQIDAINTVASTKAAWKGAVVSHKTINAAMSIVLLGFRSYVRQMFAGDTATLADFGIVTKKRATPTPAAKVVAAAKARSTRTARGTMGPKQKAAIHGTLTGPVTIPVPVLVPPHK